MASTFLQKNDSRLRLNTIVTNISYTDDSVSVFNHDGSCIEADYAISTFSYVGSPFQIKPPNYT